VQTNLSEKFSDGLAGALEKAHTPPTRGSSTQPSPRVVLTGRQPTDITIVAPTPAPSKAVVIEPKPAGPAAAPAQTESNARMAAQLRELAAKVQAGKLTGQALADQLKEMMARLVPAASGANQGG